MPAAKHEHELAVRRNQPDEWAELFAGLSNGQFTISYTREGQWKTIATSMLLQEGLSQYGMRHGKRAPNSGSGRAWGIGWRFLRATADE
jgi:hypothetical protein